MTWKNALTKILSPHLSEESLQRVLHNIEESSYQTDDGLPPRKGNGYGMPVGMTAYLTIFIKAYPEYQALLHYSFDEKGGLSPNISWYPLSKEDFKLLDEVDDWPGFSLEHISRISEFPYMKEILEEQSKQEKKK